MVKKKRDKKDRKIIRKKQRMRQSRRMKILLRMG